VQAYSIFTGHIAGNLLFSGRRVKGREGKEEERERESEREREGTSGSNVEKRDEISPGDAQNHKKTRTAQYIVNRESAFR